MYIGLETDRYEPVGYPMVVINKSDLIPNIVHEIMRSLISPARNICNSQVQTRIDRRTPTYIQLFLLQPLKYGDVRPWNFLKWGAGGKRLRMTDLRKLNQ